MKAKMVRAISTIVVLGAILAIAILYLLTRLERRDLAPAVCDKLSYTRGQSIYLVNPDGSKRARLTRSPEKFDEPVRLIWSPDGTQLAYSIGDLTRYDARLYIIDADGDNLRLLTDIRAHSYFGWSPDGKYIYTDYVGSGGLHSLVLHTIETGEVICVASYDGYHPEINGCGPFDIYYGKQWLPHETTTNKKNQRWALAPKIESSVVYRPSPSPDGYWVAIPAFDAVSYEYNWHIAGANGDDLHTYYTTSNYKSFCYNAAWSRDSKYVAFASRQDNQMLIWIVHPSTGKVSSPIHLHIDGCPHLPRWSADEQHLAFLADGGWYTLQIPSNELILSVDNNHCEWSPDGNWLGCHGPDHIAVLNAFGTERFDLSAERGQAAWSPTGQWFAYSTSEGIYVFDLTTCQSVQVADQRGIFAWTPPCE